MLRDSSATPTDLVSRLEDCPGSPNCVCTQATRASQLMPALDYHGEPERAMDLITQVLSSLPRVRIVARQPNHLHATATSRVFRFVDDIEFLVEESSRQIHFRSASRFGHSDLGVNRKRMTDICERLLEYPEFSRILLLGGELASP